MASTFWPPETPKMRCLHNKTHFHNDAYYCRAKTIVSNDTQGEISICKTPLDEIATQWKLEFSIFSFLVSSQILIRWRFCIKYENKTLLSDITIENFFTFAYLKRLPRMLIQIKDKARHLLITFILHKSCVELTFQPLSNSTVN